MAARYQSWANAAQRRDAFRAQVGTFLEVEAVGINEDWIQLDERICRHEFTQKNNCRVPQETCHIKKT